MGVEEYDVVETLFRKLTFPEYYLTLHGLADSLDANELYNANRPVHVPPGARFREHVTAMKELGLGADRGDSLLKEQRQAMRDLSELDVYSSINYMRTIAIHKKDPALMHRLGLPPKDGPPKSTSRKATVPHAIEIHVELRHVKAESGSILIMGSHLRNGGPYQINLCKGEPISEDSWYNPGGHYTSCRRIVMRKLEPANRYYVRMRTDGPNGPGNWSHPVSIIVL